MSSKPKKKKLHIPKSLRHQTPLEGGATEMIKKKYPANKPELKKLLVFSVTPFKIDQNKIQNHSTDKVQNLGNERR